MSTTALYKALVEAGASDKVAERAVEGLIPAPSEDLATKADIAKLRTEIAELRTELKTEMADQRTELIKWVVGMNLAGWGVVIAAVGLIAKF